MYVCVFMMEGSYGSWRRVYTLQLYTFTFVHVREIGCLFAFPLNKKLGDSILIVRTVKIELVYIAYTVF
jgi:hypothetical protein